MENWRKFLDPDEMAPKERLDRIVEILATAVIRMVQEEKRSSDQPPDKEPQRLSAPKGRLPFGQKKIEGRRDIDATERRLIEWICTMAAEGCSSEKIAKTLNAEDRETKRAGKWSRTAVWRILQRIKKEGVTK